MKKAIFFIILLGFISFHLQAQVSFYCSPGFTFAYSNANLSQLQDSYDSYLEYAENTYSGDSFEAPKNWTSSGFIPGYSFHLGVAGGGVHFTVSHFGYRLKQTRAIIRESGYGRKFVWREKRNEFLFDLGYGGKKLDAFFSFGTNFNHYKMSSYQVYPSGVESMSNAFNFNGNYRVYDVGLSYGLGVKIKPINYLAIDLRLVYAGTNLPGEKRNKNIGDDPALADNTISRTPTTEQYPADYTEPINLENEIVPDFSRLCIRTTILFYLKFD